MKIADNMEESPFTLTDSTNKTRETRTELFHSHFDACPAIEKILWLNGIVFFYLNKSYSAVCFPVFLCCRFVSCGGAGGT